MKPLRLAERLFWILLGVICVLFPVAAVLASLFLISNLGGH